MQSVVLHSPSSVKNDEMLAELRLLKNHSTVDGLDYGFTMATLPGMPAVRFIENDSTQQSHWFDLQPDQVLEGLLVEAGEERRVYVVTSEAPEGLEWVHDRWPLTLKLR